MEFYTLGIILACFKSPSKIIDRESSIVELSRDVFFSAMQKLNEIIVIFTLLAAKKPGAVEFQKLT